MSPDSGSGTSELRLTKPTRRAMLHLLLALGIARFVRFDGRDSADTRIVEVDGWILRGDDLS